METKEQIEKLEKIRRELTAIYMELGNPEYVEADSILNQDIIKLKEKLGL